VLRGSPPFLDMIDSSEVLYDRDNFFGDYLKGLARKMKKLGSIRVKRGNAWYWILKPDYKQGASSNYDEHFPGPELSHL
jgi:hypothetical protein